MKQQSFIQIIIFLLSILIVFGFYFAISIPSPVIISQSFSIAKGESINSIGSRLKQENLIYSEWLFRFYLKLIGKAKSIKAGYYIFPPRPSLVEVINFITDSKNIHDGIFLVKEGDTLKDIERNLQNRNIINQNDSLESYLIADFINEYPLLFDGAPLNNNLEGYLFPDSYHFPPGLTTKEIINAFLSNFNNKIKENDINLTNKYSAYENIIMASILEKEVIGDTDKRLVADILWRRLEKRMPLEVDASICYALTKSFNDCKLSKDAFKIDSPYNTYLYQGLPKTPISNPGLESLKAALNPLPNDYWYYLTDRKTGKTIYSKTYEEHLKMRQKYL
jgi:UPF0755 protein